MENTKITVVMATAIVHLLNINQGIIINSPDEDGSRHILFKQKSSDVSHKVVKDKDQLKHYANLPNGHTFSFTYTNNLGLPIVNLPQDPRAPSKELETFIEENNKSIRQYKEADAKRTKKLNKSITEYNRRRRRKHYE